MNEEDNGRIVGLVFYENPVNDVYFSLRPGYEKLADGFHFVESKRFSVEKIMECCWKGFDHEKDEGSWNGDAEYGYYKLMAPHIHPEDSTVIENDEGQGKPEIDNIIKLTEIYHVSADYILLGTEKKWLIQCPRRKVYAKNTVRQSVRF